MTSARPHIRNAALAAALLAASCAAPSDFPSLLPREAESNPTWEEPAREPVIVASDPGLIARTAELLALARQGQRDFEAAYGPASAATARAGAAGSESWIEAQQAISRAEAARAETTRAVAELDALSLARATIPTNSQDFATLRAAIEEAAALARDQSERIDRLRAQVRPG